MIAKLKRKHGRFTRIKYDDYFMSDEEQRIQELQLELDNSHIPYEARVKSISTEEGVPPEYAGTLYQAYDEITEEGISLKLGRYPEKIACRLQKWGGYLWEDRYE